MRRNKIKAMIIDDSALMRNLISSMLGDCNQIEVVGTAINGKFGLKKLNFLKPDIIILDLEMPEVNGIEFLKERSKLEVKTPVIILSAHAKKGAKITLKALSLGASDFILKPSGSAYEIKKTKEALIEMTLALAKPVSCIEHKKTITYKTDLKIIPTPQFEIGNLIQPINSISDINVLSIGISTGGPNALRKILPLFPKNFPVPIVIVQHMPAGFTYEFAKGLDSLCPLFVKEAENNDIVKQGRILIAPGDMHIRFVKKKLGVVISLDDSPPVNGHKPSADILFESTAKVFGQNSIGCIMTGMGRDGAKEIGMILESGGITIAQDQNTSVIFGMPRVAIEMNNIHLVRSLDDIVSTIIDILKKQV